MSLFYASLHGINKTPRTARGHRAISSDTRTWDHGIEVVYTKLEDDTVQWAVYETLGSRSNSKRARLIASGRRGALIKE